MSTLHHFTFKHRQHCERVSRPSEPRRSFYEYTIDYYSPLSIVRPSRGYVCAEDLESARQKILDFYGDRAILETLNIQVTDIIILED